MSDYDPAIPVQVESIILTVRGQKVILDSDLAALYGVTTSRLNQQVRRNPDRFPEDFMFRLTSAEVDAMRSQIVIASRAEPRIAPGSRRNIRYRPYAFTAHGAIMAASVLNSPEAVRMSLFVVRAFVKMRQAVGQTRELADKLAELERKLTERLDSHEDAIALILSELKRLMAPPPNAARTPIGFSVRERLATYRTRRSKRPTR